MSLADPMPSSPGRRPGIVVHLGAGWDFLRALPWPVHVGVLLQAALLAPIVAVMTGRISGAAADFLLGSFYVFVLAFAATAVQIYYLGTHPHHDVAWRFIVVAGTVTVLVKGAGLILGVDPNRQVWGVAFAAIGPLYYAAHALMMRRRISRVGPLPILDGFSGATVLGALSLLAIVR